MSNQSFLQHQITGISILYAKPASKYTPPRLPVNSATRNLLLLISALIKKGANPVFYVSNKSINIEDDTSYEKYFRQNIQNFLDYEDEFSKNLPKSEDELTDYQNKQRSLINFIFSHIICFLKFWEYIHDCYDEKNYYLEREWRIFNGFKFTLEDVRRIILPKSYAKKFREDFRDYVNEIIFSDIAV